MRRKELSIFDLEELYNEAEYIISTAEFNFYRYDEDGDYISYDMTVEERHAQLEKWLTGAKEHYLCFCENEELHQISPYDAMEMPLSEIKEKYLKEYLTKLRMILRKGTADLNGAVVSDEVPDSYLEDLLALRWRGNLVLFAMKWYKKQTREQIANKASEAADES